MNSLVKVSVVALAISSLGGCIHNQLRFNSVKQAETVMDIANQQILDNLAVFVVNPDAIPSLAVPTGATNAVNDQAGAGTTPTFTAGVKTPWGTSLNGQRQFQENWSLKPVVESDRLARIRCAYQIVIGTYEPNPFDSGCPSCPDCIVELAKMGLLPQLPLPPNPLPAGTTDTKAKEEYRTAEEEYQKAMKKYCTDFPEQLECHFPREWFGVETCSRKVPKNACHVAKHCGKYVWVSADGLDELSRFTLTVIKLASNDPPAPHAQVVRKYGPTGELTETDVTTQEDFIPHVTSAPDKLPHFSGKPRFELRRDPPADALRGLIQLNTR